MNLSASSLHRALLLATAALILPSAAAASVISVNFEGRNPGGAINQVEVGASANTGGPGNIGVAGLNGNDVWNDIATGSAFSGPITGKNGETATLNAGTGNGHWGIGGARIVADEDPSGDLLHGWQEGRDDEDQWDVEVTGLSADFPDGFQVYVYIGGSQDVNASLDGVVRVNASSKDFTTNVFAGTFIEGDNFHVFRGLSGDSFTISGGGVDNANRSGLLGFEIVAIPEPSSLLIAGIAGLVGVFGRRRA